MECINCVDAALTQSMHSKKATILSLNPYSYDKRTSPLPPTFKGGEASKRLGCPAFSGISPAIGGRRFLK